MVLAAILTRSSGDLRTMPSRPLSLMLAAASLLVPVVAQADPAPRRPASRPAAAATAHQVSSRDADTALRLINAHRASWWASPVKLDPQLNAAAAHQTQAMAKAAVMSHDIGGSFASRMERAGIKGAAVENLGHGYANAADAVAGWKGSWAHNVNLLNRSMSRAGFAQGVGTDGRTFWTLIMAR
jgi:uncharacterized protein YkwD